jgi:hypothetical protein
LNGSGEVQHVIEWTRVKYSRSNCSCELSVADRQDLERANRGRVRFEIGVVEGNGILHIVCWRRKVVE